MALFYLIRHGETEWNAEGRLCGQTDVALSDRGREQARRLAERLKSAGFGAIYSSPLDRALETARILAQAAGGEPVVVESLMELNYGLWEGKTPQAIQEEQPELFRAWEADPGSIAPPGGESGERALDRVALSLNSLALRHKHGNIAVVSHKTSIRLAVCYVLGLAPSEYRRRLAMENAALNIIEWRQPGWRLLLLNDTSHLSGLHSGSASMTADF